MHDVNRLISLEKLTSRKSAFLFGPRSVGKSFWIAKNLPNAYIINLLIAKDRRRYLNNPSILHDTVKRLPKEQLIVIDEVQMVPEILDEVHSIIESLGRKFLLTGSSARKLRRMQANMLGGRATRMDMGPLTWKELSDAGEFDLQRYLLYGGIPRIYFSDYPEDELSDYVDIYLDNEIKAEAATRNIFGFQRFLHFLSLCSGDTLVLSNIASDCQVSATTVRQYTEILEDTLLGYYLPPWSGPKRKAIQSSRFYLFDLGLRWFLSEVSSLPDKSDLFGKAFEQFIIQEVRAREIYEKTRRKLAFWRTTHQDEVDLLVGEDLAIDIKSKTKVNAKDARGLLKIRDEGFNGRLLLVSRDQLDRESAAGVECLYWETFLKELWGKRLGP